MFELDECYEDDIRHLVRRAQQNEEGLPLKPSVSLPPTKAEEPKVSDEEVEWVYWSMTDAILFCFTVITTIGGFTF